MDKRILIFFYYCLRYEFFENVKKIKESFSELREKES